MTLCPNANNKLVRDSDCEDYWPQTTSRSTILNLVPGANLTATILTLPVNGSLFSGGAQITAVPFTLTNNVVEYRPPVPLAMGPPLFPPSRPVP